MFSISIIVMYLAHGAPSVQDIPSALFLLMGVADGIILGGILHTYRRKRYLCQNVPQRQFLEWLETSAAAVRVVLSGMKETDPGYFRMMDIARSHDAKIAEYQNLLLKEIPSLPKTKNT